MSQPPSPSSRTASPFGAGYFSVPFERFARDEASDWAGAFTLLGAQALHYRMQLYSKHMDDRYNGDIFRLAH